MSSLSQLNPLLTCLVAVCVFAQIKGQTFHIHARHGYDHGPQVGPCCIPHIDDKFGLALLAAFMLLPLICLSYGIAFSLFGIQIWDPRDMKRWGSHVEGHEVR